jgi:hypothetical protein
MVCDDRCGITTGPAVPPGVSELQDQERPMAFTQGLPRGPMGIFYERGKSRSRSRVEPELPGIGSPFFHDRCRLEPDQPRSTRREATIAAESELGRGAVRPGVAPFHREHDQAIRQTEPWCGGRLKQGTQIVAGLQFEAQIRDPLAQLLQ